jgi:Ca2+-binding RTX toxin-like protein
MATITGSKTKNDILVGTSGADTIYGLGGNDTLYGGATKTANATNTGNDVLDGGDGNDILYGGDGNDTLIGGLGNDTLFSEAGDDTLNITHGGNDTVQGGAGKDVIVADAAFTKDDKIDGGTSSDTLSLKGDYSAGTVFTSTTLTSVEKIDLGSGFSYNFTLHDATVAATAVLTINGSSLLGTNTFIVDGSGELDGQLVLQGGQGADRLTGGALADTVTGGAGDDFLTGGKGGDTLTGGIGYDSLQGGAGNDTLDGGAGFDVASYALSSSGVAVNLATGAASGGDAQGDSIVFVGGVSTIENVAGSGAGDQLMGDAQANQLLGQGGNDTLGGGAGTDLLVGGEGNDVLDGGAGNDLLDGGAGIDGASYLTSSAGVAVNLATGAASGGDAQGDAFVMAAGVSVIENLIGSSFDDKLTGDAQDNRLGGQGGNDTLVGGTGNDALTGAGGNDSIDGGFGNDIAIFSGFAKDYLIQTVGQVTTVKDLAGDDGTDTIVGVELMQFTDLFVAVDHAPVITSGGGGDTANVSAPENTTAVATVTATDQDSGQSLTYGIAGGADGSLFEIDSTTGALAFLAARNFESPGDANADNIYEVTVQVDDGAGGIDTQAIKVGVTDVAEAPAITSDGGGDTASISIAENTTAVTTVSATDEDQPAQSLTYSISGGADESLFVIDPDTGALAFATAPDFEQPADSDGDNVYDVAVQASDGTLTDTQDIAVSVADVNEGALLGTSGTDGINDTPQSDVIQALGGNDFISIGRGGEDSVDAGSGIDFIATGGLWKFDEDDGWDLFDDGSRGWSEGDFIDGGEGYDYLLFRGEFPTGVTFTKANLANIENIVLYNDISITLGSDLLTDGAGLFIGDPNLSATLKLDASAIVDGYISTGLGGGDDVVLGGAGNDMIDLIFGGKDTVHAGAGDDSLRIGHYFDSSSIVDGGDGYDSLEIDDRPVDPIVCNATTITNIEELHLRFDVNGPITTHDATVAAGATLTVFGQSGSHTFDGSAETDGHFNYDIDFNSSFKGGSQSDIFRIFGGGNTLTGGNQGEADRFEWQAGSLSGNTSSIKDFTQGTGEDVLDISDLLNGYDGSQDLSEFVKVTNSGGNTTISVDANGTANGSSYTPLAVLTGVTTDLSDLVAGGNLDAGPNPSA